MVPKVQSKASLSVCSARIVCVAVVPGARLISDKNGGVSKMTESSNKSRSLKHKKSFPSDMSDDDDNFGSGAQSIMAFDSSGDEDDPIPGRYGVMGTSFLLISFRKEIYFHHSPK